VSTHTGKNKIVCLCVGTMLNNKHFPPSRITALNRDTHATWSQMSVQWYLVADSARFHTFLVAELGTPINMIVRIDWHAISVLECRPYVPEHGDEHIAVGETSGFWLGGIVACLMRYDRDYHLFAYNCRTVSYLILTEYCRFDARCVFELYETHKILCGVEGMDACISIDEFIHYIHHRELEASKGTDVDKELGEAGHYLNKRVM
jgi:hypothetical protein